MKRKYPHQATHIDTHTVFKDIYLFFKGIVMYWTHKYTFCIAYIQLHEYSYKCTHVICINMYCTHTLYMRHTPYTHAHTDIYTYLVDNHKHQNEKLILLLPLNRSAIETILLVWCWSSASHRAVGLLSQSVN